MQDTYLLTSINSVGGNLLQLNMTQISWRIELTWDWDEHLMRKILNIYIYLVHIYLPLSLSPESNTASSSFLKSIFTINSSTFDHKCHDWISIWIEMEWTWEEHKICGKNVFRYRVSPKKNTAVALLHK